MNNKIKDALGIVIIISLLIVAYTAVRAVKTYTKTSEPTSFRSFSVGAEGKAVVVPDVAQFTFSVITEGGLDVTKLQKENTEKMNKAIAFLKENKVDEKDIKTEGYYLQPRYTYFSCRDTGPCPPPRIDGYSINQSVQVKARDFEKVGDILSGIVRNGANSVSGLNFTVDDRTAVENEARQKAIEKAKEKAKAIANAGGFKLGRLLSIEESSTQPPRYFPLEAGFGGGGDLAVKEAPSIEPGSQDVMINVTLRYEIE